MSELDTLALYAERSTQEIYRLRVERDTIARDVGLLTETLRRIGESLGVEEDPHMMDDAAKRLCAELSALKAAIPALVEAAWQDGWNIGYSQLSGFVPDQWVNSQTQKKLKEMKL